MTDHFAVLDQPRRPWLDLGELKERYQELARSEHPDQKGRSAVGPGRRPEAPPTFGEINEAYRVLSEPRLRLRHLLTLEGKTPQANEPLSPALMDLFSRTATAINEIDRVLQKWKAADNALTKSLLQPEVLKARRQTEELLAGLEKHHANAVGEIRELDTIWDNQKSETLDRLPKLARPAWLSQPLDRTAPGTSVSTGISDRGFGLPSPKSPDRLEANATGHFWHPFQRLSGNMPDSAGKMPALPQDPIGWKPMPLYTFI